MKNEFVIDQNGVLSFFDKAEMLGRITDDKAETKARRNYHL